MALVVIGGNGSQSGSASLAREGFPVLGVPSTIDNDLYGNDVSMAATPRSTSRSRRSTACAPRPLRTSASRGRDHGARLRLHRAHVGIAGGAEVIAIPEVDITPAEVAGRLRDAYRRGKTHALAVIMEKARCGCTS